MKMLMPGKASAAHEAHQPAAPEAVPGKVTLTQHLAPAPVAELTEAHVKPYKGARVEDGGHFKYVVLENGSFAIEEPPRGSKVPKGTVIARAKLPEAWLKLATRLLVDPPQVKKDTVPPVKPPPLPAKEATAKLDDLVPTDDKLPGEATFHHKKHTVEGNTTLEIANTRVKKGDANTHYNWGAAAKPLMDGDKDADTFFCSGLQVWTLAAAGYDMYMPIRGANGKPYTFTLIDSVDNKDVSKTVTVNMKQLIDGEPATVEAMSYAEKNNLTDGCDLGTYYSRVKGGDGHKAGWSKNEDGESVPNKSVRGAARAFELARIGIEVDEKEQKPGDFAQSRHLDTKKGKTEHDGTGHAWQVAAVKAEGRALFGQEGSPTPEDKQPRSGWCDNVVFVIEDSTNPACVGAHRVLEAKRLEANIKEAMNDWDPKADKKAKDALDGGVQVTGWRPVGVEDKKSDLHVFIGRLGTSKWLGWHPEPATEAPQSADPDADGKLV